MSKIDTTLAFYEAMAEAMMQIGRQEQKRKIIRAGFEQACTSYGTEVVAEKVVNGEYPHLCKVLN